MSNQNKSKHKTIWEDQKSAMLGSCGDFVFSPNNAPVLLSGDPIKCPHCGEYIVLHWNVFVTEISEEKFLRMVSGKRVIIDNVREDQGSVRM